MRFRGKEYTGKGISIAVIDSGVDIKDPRLRSAEITGWSIALGATGHALLSANFEDENGHGTEIAAAIHKLAPDAKILAVKIMGERLRASADLMAAGIETSARNGAQIVNLSLGTPNMGKALLLRDCCANAVEAGSVVLAAAHPKGERAYPADLPETVGVASHPDCPIDKVFYFPPKVFPRKDWGALSAKFLTHGYSYNADGECGKYKGTGLSCAFMAGRMACLREAMPGVPVQDVIKAARNTALFPSPKIGYS